MKIFAIGDLHLSFDERIEKPMDVFGPRWVNHYQRVREHWEAMVGSEDVVIIPGDVSWGLRQEEALADFAWIHQLPGHKVITKGNHDLWWTSVTKLNKLYDDITFLQNHCFPAGRAAVAARGAGSARGQRALMNTIRRSTTGSGCGCGFPWRKGERAERRF